MGVWPPGERVQFQLPSSKAVCSHMQEVKQRWREAYMAEQLTPDKIQA